MFIRKFIAYIRTKIKYSSVVRFDHTVMISPDSSFEGSNSIGNNSSFRGHMGFGTYCGNHCSLQGNIGRFCSFGENCKAIFWKHPISYPYVSTSPMFYSTRKQSSRTFANRQIFKEILPPPIWGNDVWVGSNVVFIGSVKIGDGAVVLTNAVVTKDVEPYQIVGGVPAKPIGYRYEKEDIDFLLDYKWWNKTNEWFEEHWAMINDFEKLKEYVAHEKETDRQSD